MSSLYRIFCETDEKWEYKWGPGEPTECPTNPAHTVNPNSISVKKPKFNEDFTVNLKLTKQEMSETDYLEILSFLYQGSQFVGTLKKIEVTFSMDKNGKYKTGSSNFGFYLQIRDITNSQIVYETSEVNATEIISSGEIIVDSCVCSTHPASWCIQIKKSTNAGNINIRHLRLIFF